MDKITINSVSMTPYNGEPVLRTFDNTKMVALNTCPTWGIVRYEHHKRFAAAGRAMPLEAGGAAHEAYAAIRLGDLYFNGHTFYPDIDCRDVAIATAYKLFAESRVETWLQVISRGEEDEQNILLGALDIFATSGFYDDPYDRRRTIANIEESLIAYTHRYPLGKTMPIVQGDFVGVEIPIDMLLTLSTDDTDYQFRFIGRVDGVHWKNIDKQVIRIEENKTGSRLDEAWEQSFAMSHQVTGYMLAISNLIGHPVEEGVVRGMAIPLPKAYDFGGINNVSVYRDKQKFVEWAEWVLHTHLVTAAYVDNPLDAPKYTHSCNRYFRPCPLIPFCDSPKEDRQAMLDEMITDKWSPLEEGSD